MQRCLNSNFNAFDKEKSAIGVQLRERSGWQKYKKKPNR